MRHFITSFLVGALMFAASARATRVLPEYDLDSLWKMSDEVVRARVGESMALTTVDGDCRIYAVTVEGMLKGKLAVGTVVWVNGLDEYWRARIENGQLIKEPLRKKDSVYLFLAARDKARGYSKYKLTKAEWTVIESGVRLVAAEQVHGFSQLMGNMGDRNATSRPRILFASSGYVQEVSAVVPDAVVETPAEFEKQVADARDDTQRLEILLHTPMSADVEKRIIDELCARETRLHIKGFASDTISYELADRLENTSPAKLLDLLEAGKTNAGLALASHLRHRAGREYLLSVIADARESDERRALCAQVLAEAGWTYQQEARAGTPADLAARLANLAADHLQAKWSDDLLRGLGGCAPASSSLEDSVKIDLQQAAAVLASAFSSASSPNQFRLAEVIMQLDQEQYKHLFPGAGPMLTRLSPGTDLDQAIRTGKLHGVCQFRNQLAVESTLKLVLHPTSSGSEIEIPVETEVGKWTQTFGKGNPISADVRGVAPGHYRAFLRDYMNSQPSGDGIGFELELPEK